MHGHPHSAPSPRRRLTATLVLTAVVMVAELVGGLRAGSLALLADAGHMLTDVLALALAVGAIALASRPADGRRTYGYRRLEVLAALLNGLALLAVAGGIGVAAVGRLQAPAAVATGTMVGVAAVGLGVNLLGLVLLGHPPHDLNVRAAWLHLVGDTLSSLGVLAGGAAIALTGWAWLDPLLSLAIAAGVVYGSVRLLRDAVDVLLEAAPRGLEAAVVSRCMVAVQGVAGVHDVHVWSIAPAQPALSAHVVLRADADAPHLVLGRVQQALATQLALHHVTLQLEPAAAAAAGCGCPPGAA